MAALRARTPPTEGLSEAFPGRLDELGGAHDLFELRLGTVSPHVVFLEYLPKGHLVLHAGDYVIGNLLLARGEGRASRAPEEPLPEGWTFAHEDRWVLPFAFMRGVGLILPAGKRGAYPRGLFTEAPRRFLLRTLPKRGSKQFAAQERLLI